MTMPTFDAVKNGKTHTVGSYELHINWEHNIGRCEYQKVSDMDAGGNHAFQFTGPQFKTVWEALPPAINGGHNLQWLQLALQALQKELLFLEDGITKP